MALIKSWSTCCTNSAIWLWSAWKSVHMGAWLDGCVLLWCRTIPQRILLAKNTQVGEAERGTKISSSSLHLKSIGTAPQPTAQPDSCHLKQSQYITTTQPTHPLTHTNCALASTAHHPPTRQLQHTQNYLKSLTSSYALTLCSFPWLTTATTVLVIDWYKCQLWSLATNVLTSNYRVFRTEVTITKPLFWLQMKQTVSENQRCNIEGLNKLFV